MLLEESRRTVDKKITRLRDIDSKATRSIRVSLVVVGFLIAGPSVFTGNGSRSLGGVTWAYIGLGALSLSVSIVSALGTLAASQYKDQLTREERIRLLDELQDENGEPTRHLAHLNFGWAGKLDSEIEQNLSYFTVTLVTLLSGALFLFAAGIAIVLQTLLSAPLSSLPADQRAAVKFVGGIVGIVAVLGTTVLIIQRTEVDTQ